MRTSLYISVILGITFLTLRFIGLFLDLTYNDLFLLLGLIFLVAIALPIYLRLKHNYKQKVKSILDDYGRGGHEDRTVKKEKASDTKRDDEQSKEVEYPSFRNQKQGLKWGGGNIHAANATRGSKRSFMKR